MNTASLVNRLELLLGHNFQNQPVEDDLEKLGTNEEAHSILTGTRILPLLLLLIINLFPIFVMKSNHCITY